MENSPMSVPAIGLSNLIHRAHVEKSEFVNDSMGVLSGYVIDLPQDAGSVRSYTETALENLYSCFIGTGPGSILLNVFDLSDRLQDLLTPLPEQADPISYLLNTLGNRYQMKVAQLFEV